MVERILFISIFKEGYGGGEGRVAYEMARWFAQHYQVVMLCPGKTTGLTIDETGFQQFEVKSSGETNLYLSLLDAFTLKKIYDFLDSFQPQVIHMHDPALMAVIGQLWAKHRRVPAFYTAHILPSRALDFGAKEITRLLATPVNEMLVEKYLLNFYENCDAVIGLNQNVATMIRDFGYDGRIFQIPNGRNLALYHTSRSADLQEKEKRLTFVGSLGKRKNQAFLIEAMQFLPENYRLQLLGVPLDRAYLQELNKIIARLRVQVDFLGQLSQEEVAGVLAQTHVFVSASKMEVQSLAIIEALASGLPVVALSNETTDELVDDAVGAHLPKDASAEAFAAAVRRVCELPQAGYETMCANAHNRVEALDWSKVMQRTIQSYETVIAEQAQKAGHSAPYEFAKKYVEQIPIGRLRDEMARIIAYIPKRPRKRIFLPVKTLGIAIFNMNASVTGYYLLKVRLWILGLFRKNKKA